MFWELAGAPGSFQVILAACIHRETRRHIFQDGRPQLLQAHTRPPHPHKKIATVFKEKVYKEIPIFLYVHTRQMQARSTGNQERKKETVMTE